MFISVRIGTAHLCRPIAVKYSNAYCLSSLARLNANEFITKARSAKSKEPTDGSQTKQSKNAPLIMCKRQEFNHYPGQIYGKFDAIPLASIGWHHKKSKGDYFIIGGSNQLPEPTKPAGGVTFNRMGISEELVEALDRQGITEPTTIQSRGIPTLLLGNNALLAAETGCGKTLAFLLPILQQIQMWKPLVENRSEQMNSPLGLIISPSRELAHQIGDVVNDLSSDSLPVSCKVLTGGRTKAKMMHPEMESVDLLIATLGALSKLTTTGVYNMRHVRHVVLDEADTLLDDSFSEKLRYFLRKFPFHFKGAALPGVFPNSAQLTLVSATMPTTLPETLAEIILPESLHQITSDRLHHYLNHVPQRFLRLNRADKPGELLRLLKSETKHPIIIFSNKSSTCDWISLFLTENNIECVNLNGDMPLLVRAGKFKKFRSGEINVLSCTDIASRGLDTINVKHVINYDFPLYTADYIHRCGRTGRVGSPRECRVINFVTGSREVDLVQKIELSARKLDALPNVNANISKVIHERLLRNSQQATESELNV